MGATKEKQLRENLDKMLDEWNYLKFTVNFWKYVYFANFDTY